MNDHAMNGRIKAAENAQRAYMLRLSQRAAAARRSKAGK